MSTQSVEPRLVNGTRDQRYGEVLLAFFDTPIRIEVYNTYGLNDCPQDLWDELSPDQIAAETGATMAVLNGPRYWMMDGIGKVDNVEAHLRDFGGISMRRVATIIVDAPPDRAPYTEVTVNRGAVFYFDAGKPLYELVSPEGRHYALQAYCTGVDKNLRASDLANLAERLAVPTGWHFTVRIPDTDVKVDTTTSHATVIQDEFENTYTLLS